MSRMSLETAIRLSAEVKGGANITRVQRSLQDLAKGGELTRREMNTLRTTTLQLASANTTTIAGIRNSVTAFRGLQEQARIGSREFTRYGAEIQKLEGKLRGLEGTARKASPALNGLGAAAGRLVAAYAGIETVRFVFGNAAELESQTRSLDVLTGSADRAKQIVQELQQLGAVTPFTSAELIDTAKRLQAFGVETEKVVDITKRLADVSGATGAELAGLATAYGQVQAKGRLQGEELLQFQERGVALQQVLREEYKLSGVEFQKALEGGKISAEAVEFALKKLTDTGGKYANGAIAQSDTLNGRLSTLSDSVQGLARTIGSSLAPVFKWALTQATAVVSEIQRMIDEANNTGGARDREAQFARNADAAVRGMGLNPFTQQGMMADMRQRNIEQQRADYRLRQQNARATNAAPPASVLPPPLGGASGAAAGAAGAAAGGGGAARQQSAEDRIAAMPFGREIIAAAKANSIDPALYAGLVGQESGFRQSAVSRSGAIGLAQLMPGTARELGVNPRDPMENLMGGAKYLRQQMDRFGLEGGLRAYNQGPGAQQRTPGGNSEESRAYPGKVLARARRFGFDGDGSAEGMEAIGRRIDTRAEQERRLEAARDLVTAEEDRRKILAAVDPLEKMILESKIKQRNTEKEFNAKIKEPDATQAEKQTLQMALQKALQNDILELERGIADLRNDAMQPVFDMTKEYGNRLAYEREYGGLLATGINPELAKQFMEIDRIAEASRTNLQAQIETHEALIAQLPAEDALRKSLEDKVKLKRELLGLVPKAATEAKDDATETAKVVTDRERQEADAKAKAERLKDLYKGIASTIEDGIVGAIQTGIDGLIDGTQRLDEALKEILSGVLRDIANQLLRFAVTTGLNALGGLGGGGGGGLLGFGMSGQLSPGLFSGAGPVSFAGGGYTGDKSRTGGIDGQGGFPAILHPQETVIDHSRMMAVPFQATPAAAPNDLAVPFQGAAAPTASGVAAPSQAATATAASLAVPFMKAGNSSPAAMAAEAARAMASTPLEPIKVRVESQVINGVEYVTTSQLREATEAAAMAGRDSAYDGMRNNPSIQRSLGMR